MGSSGDGAERLTGQAWQQREDRAGVRWVAGCPLWTLGHPNAPGR
ncbi:hypothetical protein ACFPN7_10080 [Amycolatopsis halotolerans]